MAWQVRRAVPADAKEIARIKVVTWRAAYRGVIPDAVLDRLSVESLTRNWAYIVARPDPDAVFVAFDPDAGEETLAAYCSVSAVREERDAHPGRRTAELRALYAAPPHWGTGAGRAVHDRAVQHLVEAGFEHAVLWVLVDNPRARRFYEARGWRCDEVVQDLDLEGGYTVPEIRYSRALGSG
ncbi:MAG TPA: GNAT family N-acetyltransferase [Pseudonocardiaceae bacterium]